EESRKEERIQRRIRKAREGLAKMEEQRLGMMGRLPPPGQTGAASATGANSTPSNMSRGGGGGGEAAEFAAAKEMVFDNTPKGGDGGDDDVDLDLASDEEYVEE